MDFVFGCVFFFFCFFQNPDVNFKLNFEGDSTSDDTEGTEINELLGEEEDAEGCGDLPSPTNEPLEHTMSNQIPLQRIAMSVRHKKHWGSKILKAGWMVHFTNSSVDKKVYFLASLCS